MSRSPTRLACRLVAVAALLAVSGCPECEDSNSKSGARSVTSTARGYPESTRYFGVRAKKSGSGGSYAYTPFLLRPPYDIEVTFGIFDPESLPIADQGAGCLNFQSEDFVTTFYAVCARYQRSPEGIVLETGPVTSEVFLDGEQKAVIRGAAEGDVLRLYGRRVGDATWTELGSGFPIGPAGLRIGGAASFVPAGAEVGFDDLAVSAGIPAGATPEETVAVSLIDAISAGYAAVYALDLDTPDFSGAAGLMETAGTSLASAETACAALGTKEGKKAAKKVRSAAKKLAKAQARAVDENASASLKLLSQASKSLIQALDSLLAP